MYGRGIPFLWVAILAIAIAVLPVSARASYLEAMDAHAAGDFAQARAGFERMARLGHALSQYNLAALMLNGQGGPARPGDSLAWAATAAETGDPSALRLMNRQTTPSSATDAQQEAQDPRVQYGHRASVARIEALLAAEPPEPVIPKMLSDRPLYPSAARAAGQEGWVLVDFELLPDGRVQDPRAQHQLGDSDLLLRPALINTISLRYMDVASTVPRRLYRPMTFSLQGSEGHRVLQDQLAELCAQGDAGNATALYRCGMFVLADHRALRPGHDRNAERRLAKQRVIRAALLSKPDAVLWLGSTLASSAAPAVRDEGVLWLELAAHAGHEVAMLRVIDAWLASPAAQPDRSARIVEWLAKLEASTDEYVLKHVARLRLQSLPAAEDPTAALAAIRRSALMIEFDPDANAIEAQALARVGQFKEAVKSQRDAIRLAKRYRWPVEDLERRLAAYVAGRAE